MSSLCRRESYQTPRGVSGTPHEYNMRNKERQLEKQLPHTLPDLGRLTRPPCHILQVCALAHPQQPSPFTLYLVLCALPQPH